MKELSGVKGHWGGKKKVVTNSRQILNIDEWQKIPDAYSFFFKLKVILLSLFVNRGLKKVSVHQVF